MQNSYAVIGHFCIADMSFCSTYSAPLRVNAQYAECDGCRNETVRDITISLLQSYWPLKVANVKPRAQVMTRSCSML
jgi:hypothetical protein